MERGNGIRPPDILQGTFSGQYYKQISNLVFCPHRGVDGRRLYRAGPPCAAQRSVEAPLLNALCFWPEPLTTGGTLALADQVIELSTRAPDSAARKRYPAEPLLVPIRDR